MSASSVFCSSTSELNTGGGVVCVAFCVVFFGVVWVVFGLLGGLCGLFSRISAME